MGMITLGIASGVTAPERATLETALAGRARIVQLRDLSEDRLKSAWRELDVYVGGPSKELLEGAPRLRVIQGMGHGINAIPREILDEMRSRGVILCKSVGSSVAMAEYVMMALMVLSRRILILHHALVAGDDSIHPRVEPGPDGLAEFEMDGKTLLVLGLGGVGVELCKRAAGFNMRLLGYQRSVSNELAAQRGLAAIYGPGQLHEALAGAEFIANTLPLTPETRGLIDAAAFAAMKRGAYIANVGRAQTMNADALYEALRSGQLGGAALDVWDGTTPPGPRARFGRYPARHPFHQFNVLMTPHMSGVSAEMRTRRTALLVENVIRLSEGRPLLRQVDLDAAY